MLQIDITGFSGENLILEVDGRPNNGRSSPTKGEEVHWKVKNTSGVKYIEAITMKPIIGSEDVFSSNPPSPQNDQKKAWKATVNATAEDDSVYVYKIEWIKEADGSPHTFDPILSIKPTPPPGGGLHWIVALLTGIFGIIYGIYWRKKYNKIHKNNK